MENIFWEDLGLGGSEKSSRNQTRNENVKEWDPGRKQDFGIAQESEARTVRYEKEARKTGSTSLEKELQDKINASQIRLGGGKVFRFTNGNGFQRVGYAVSGLREEEVNGLCGKYEALCNDPQVGFLDFDKAVPISDQWVFCFKLPYTQDNMVSVYEMVHGTEEGPVLDGMTLLARLVQILINHQSRFTQKAYQPLRCISPHSVFVLRNPQGQISVRILPLILSGNFPGQVPNDSKCDVSTDVYSACYLACEVLSGGFAAEGVTIREPSALIQKAMAPFPGWRPSLKAFAEELELNHVGPIHQNKARAARDGDGLEDFGFLSELIRMWKDLFVLNEESISDKRDSTWRGEA